MNKFTLLLLGCILLAGCIHALPGTWSVQDAAAVTSAVQSSPESTSLISKIGESFYINIIAEKRWKILLQGLQTTLIISVASVVIGALLGAVICLMGMSKLKILRIPAHIYISILRGTPVLVLLMMIFYVVFAKVNIEPVAVAIIGFALNFAAYSAEIFRTGIESIDRGQSEAAIAMGFTRAQTFLHIVFPQALRRVVPVLKGDIINLIKMTSVVGYIAVQDLTKAGDLIRSRTFDAFFPLVMIAVLYFLLAWLVIKLIDLIEQRTDRRRQIKGGRA
jgi:polar amino acid transport system substrate-binding protein